MLPPSYILGWHSCNIQAIIQAINFDIALLYMYKKPVKLMPAFSYQENRNLMYTYYISRHIQTISSIRLANFNNYLQYKPLSTNHTHPINHKNHLSLLFYYINVFQMFFCVFFQEFLAVFFF